MANRLSHSSIQKYNTCSKQYYYHYVKKYRPKVQGSALSFGSAIDSGLNSLLLGKSLEEANKSFIDLWSEQEINKIKIKLKKFIGLAYSESDFDEDLLYQLDLEELKKETICVADPIELCKDLRKRKKLSKLTEEEQTFLNQATWYCLKNKGLIFIDLYHRKILPQIKEVKAVQKYFELENGEDKIIGNVDLIATMSDGKTYLLDNKTSSITYERDSASRSQQLILYFHALKEEYNLFGVGYLVMYKRLEKDKVKICSKCGYDGSGATHRSCNNIIEGNRCGGEWTSKCSFSAKHDIILSSVDAHIEDLVIGAVDKTNELIKTGIFPENFSACKSPFICPYIDICLKNDPKNIIQVE